MSRYIDADALYEELGRHKEMMAKQGGWSAPIIASSIDIVQRRIKGYPTADVAHVVHSHWVKKTHEWDLGDPPCDYTDFTCFNCKIRVQNKTAFCPDCGAKMDEEAEE